MRVLLWKSGCPHCLEYLKVLERINLKLPIDKKIQAKNAFRYENFGIIDHPIFEKFDPKDFDGYPFLFIEGVVYSGSTNSEQLKIMLEKHLEDDFIKN